MESEKEAVIKIENLQMNFGSKAVFKGTTLGVYPGQIIAVVVINMILWRKIFQVEWERLKGDTDDSK